MDYQKGLYIRTFDGHIANITDIHESFYYRDQNEIITRLTIDKPYIAHYGYDAYYTIYSNIIKKSDVLLRNLLEPGDFINGKQITDILDDFIITDSTVFHKEVLSNDSIESVLTREQYQRMSYQKKESQKTFHL